MPTRAQLRAEHPIRMRIPVGWRLEPCLPLTNDDSEKMHAKTISQISRVCPHPPSSYERKSTCTLRCRLERSSSRHPTGPVHTPRHTSTLVQPIGGEDTGPHDKNLVIFNFCPSSCLLSARKRPIKGFTSCLCTLYA